MPRETLTVKQFLTGLIGACEGAITAPALAVPKLARHLPRATKDLYVVVYRTTSVGPNLKGMAYALIPIGALAVPGVLTTGAALAGLYYGAATGMEGDLAEVSRKIASLTNEIDRFLVKEYLPELENFVAEPLPEGKEPIDIPLGKMLRGVACGTASGVIGSPLMTLAIAVHIPQVYYRVSKHLLLDSEVGGLLKLFVAIMLNGGFTLVPPIIGFGSVSYQVGQGAVRGYQSGFIDALKHAVGDPWDTYRALGKALQKLK